MVDSFILRGQAQLRIWLGLVAKKTSIADESSLGSWSIFVEFSSEGSLVAEKKRPGLFNGGEVMRSLFEGGRSPLSEQFLRWKLWGRWKEYVGPTIAENSEPVGLVRGVLYIWVKHSVWMQQMVFLKDQMKHQLNQKLGHTIIREIQFTMDRRQVPSTQQEQLRQNIQQIVGDSSGDDL